MDHLVSQDMLNPDEYFSDFELGNEVVYCMGQTDIQQYEIYVNSNPLSVAPPDLIPGHYSFSYNYPNPFNPATKIDYIIPKSEFVSVKIYDINGAELTTLVNEKLSSGKHSVDWDATDYPSGIYIARISSGNYYQARKMLLVK